jgi:glycine cleavage system aminomethyltransferase T
MTTAIEKSGLPKSAVVVKKMADYMLLGLQAGVTLEPEDVIDLVKEEMHTDFKALIASLGEDQAEAFIGKDVLNKIRKKNISKAKTTPATAKGSLKDVGSKPVEKEPEKISMKKFFGGF